MSSGRSIEKWAPVCGGLLAAIIFYRFFPDAKLPSTVKDLLAGALNVSCMAVGFLGTAKAILISISGKEIVKNLQELGYYAVLVDYFLAAINWSLLAAISSAALILVDFTQQNEATHFWFSCFIFVTVTAMGTTYRILRIFGKLLRAK